MHDYFKEKYEVRFSKNFEGEKVKKESFLQFKPYAESSLKKKKKKDHPGSFSMTGDSIRFS